MSGLVAFLQTRLGEDESAARRAERFKYDQPTDAPWERARLAVDRGMGLSSDEHTARWDPARALAEVAAKRRIIEEHQSVQAAEGSHPFGCETCHFDREYGVYGDGWCTTLKLLALPYAGHPDYLEEWRP